MRMDKFLKVSRIIKRRTIANEVCDRGRVILNGRVCKAGAEVKAGDIVEIHFGGHDMKFEILSTPETVSKAGSAEMYRVSAT